MRSAGMADAKLSARNGMRSADIADAKLSARDVKPRRTSWAKVGIGLALGIAGAAVPMSAKGAPKYAEEGRPNGATAAAWSGFERTAAEFLRVAGLNPYIDAMGFRRSFMHFLRDVFPLSRLLWDHAHEYYKQQQPLVEESAKNFYLHEYWNDMQAASRDDDWIDTLAVRAAGMRKQFDQNGREDFRVEKDKCDMFEFLTRNEFPLPKVYGIWRSSPTDFMENLQSGRAIPANTSYPVFLKMCHLTQGVEDSVRRFSDFQKTQGQSGEELNKFLEQKWQRHANDADRIFAEDGNVITQTLQPGVSLQAGFADPVEFKVLVIWGRAYLAYHMEAEGIVLRDGTFEQGGRTTPWGLAVPRQVADLPEIAWVQNEGHLPRIWALAESAALAMGIDQVRIDIFIRKGEPEAVTINEISLSSGMPNHMHSDFLGNLWMDPHVNSWYKKFPADVPVHLLDPSNAPNWNASRGALSEATRPNDARLKSLCTE
ncbi:unnamed protein product [Polarella glacialis]|uniref:ATP-grasp domain-containing protein n=1 Tax=Polarella glacialis TaxID=89957 RepID=A0A813G539_POLGL|nr:unnamed protein product [Polarella glacialis]